MNIYLESGELLVDSDAPDIEIHAVDLLNDLYIVQRYSTNYDGLAEAAIVKWRRGTDSAMQAEMGERWMHDWRWMPSPDSAIAEMFKCAEAAGLVEPVEVREPYNRFDPKNWGV